MRPLHAQARIVCTVYAFSIFAAKATRSIASNLIISGIFRDSDAYAISCLACHSLRTLRFSLIFSSPSLYLCWNALYILPCIVQYAQSAHLTTLVAEWRIPVQVMRVHLNYSSISRSMYREHDSFFHFFSPLSQTLGDDCMCRLNFLLYFPRIMRYIDLCSPLSWMAMAVAVVVVISASQHTHSFTRSL